MEQLKPLFEAALFCADRPLTVAELRALEPSLKPDEVRGVLEQLGQDFAEAQHGVELVELAEGFQLLTKPDYAERLNQARIAVRPRRLSPAALETLAVIAYRQPVGRSEIEEIRGVAADGVLRSLQERGLIDVAGRGEGLGRPLLYGTTSRFLEMLGVKNLAELPRLDELSVALKPENVPDNLLGDDPGDDGDHDDAESVVVRMGSEEPSGSASGAAPDA